jgi:O-antigen/teichoic acid export membrane protein
MEVFTAFCGLVFLGVILYVDIIGLILGKDFRSGIGVIPIMLLAYMFLGMLFNVSMWYKLSGRTKMAIWITLAGLVVTAFVNIVFMPKYSYWASAWGHLASYVVMFLISAYLGSRYNPFPYKWWRIILIFVLMLGVYAGSLYLDRALGLDNHLVPKLGFHTLLLLVYAGLVGLLMIPAWRVAQRAGQEEESLAAEKNKVPVVLPLDGVNARTDDSAIQIKNKETEASDKTYPKLIDTPEDEEE